MLTKIRTKHIKPVLWVVLISVAVCFLLWGVPSLRKEPTIMSINGRDIHAAQFKKYLDAAVVQYRLTMGKEFYTNINQQLLQAKAVELITLLWKANKDNLKVADEEVIYFLQRMFAINGAFDKELYMNFVKREFGMTARTLEEHIRTLLLADKVLEAYTRNIPVSEEEIEKSYAQENEQFKISYILIPYDHFEQEVAVGEDEIGQYYQEHSDEFTEKTKVKIAYLLLDNQKDLTTIDKITADDPSITNLESIATAFSLELQQSPFLSPDTSLEGIEWNPKINALAFSLAPGILSPLIDLGSSSIIFEKIDQQEEHTLKLEDVKDTIQEKLRENKKRNKAGDLAQKMLDTLEKKKIDDLEKLAVRYKFSSKTSELFKRNNPIEGLGAAAQIHNAISTLFKGQIHKQAIPLPKGTCIVKLEDFIPIDKDKFEQEKEEYRQRIVQRKAFLHRFTFLAELQKEADIKFYAAPQQ